MEKQLTTNSNLVQTLVIRSFVLFIARADPRWKLNIDLIFTSYPKCLDTYLKPQKVLDLNPIIKMCPPENFQSSVM